MPSGAIQSSGQHYRDSNIGVIDPYQHLYTQVFPMITWTSNSSAATYNNAASILQNTLNNTVKRLNNSTSFDEYKDESAMWLDT